MAENQSNELDIQINSTDIDRTEKKLRGLDRLLEQTRRRAVLLGKTRMNPTITLVDRFSSAAGKISDSLKRLNQTQAMPVVRLGANQAINSVRELRGSLASLTGTPWRVSVAGVDWEVAVGDSFTAWMSSDGKATLQRISSSISKALGDGMREFAKQAFEWESKPNKKSSNASDSILNKKRIPEFGKDGNYTGEDFLKEVLSPTEMYSSENRLYSPSSSRGSFGSTSPEEITPLSFIGDVGEEYLKDRSKDYSNDKFSEWGGKLKELWHKKWPEISARFEPKSGESIMDSLTKWVSKGGKLLGKAKPVLSKVGGPAGLLFDAIDFASADTPREKTQKVTSAVFSAVAGSYLGLGLATVLSATGPQGTALGAVIGGTVGGVLGGYAGDYFGGLLYDLVNGELDIAPNKKTREFSTRVIPSSVQGITAPSEPPVPKVVGTPISDYYELPESVREKIPGYGGTTTYKPAPTFPPPNPINVTISPGALSLTVNKDEINYKELAEKMGIKLADAMRMAMQNVK